MEKLVKVKELKFKESLGKKVGLGIDFWLNGDAKEDDMLVEDGEFMEESKEENGHREDWIEDMALNLWF